MKKGRPILAPDKRSYPKTITVSSVTLLQIDYISRHLPNLGDSRGVCSKILALAVEGMFLKMRNLKGVLE